MADEEDELLVSDPALNVKLEALYKQGQHIINTCDDPRRVSLTIYVIIRKIRAVLDSHR